MTTSTPTTTDTGDNRSDSRLTALIRDDPYSTGTARAAAIETLYDRHHAGTLRYARTFTRDAHTAQDLAAEAFVNTVRAVDAGRGPDESWRPYLLGAVQNAAFAWGRTERRIHLQDAEALEQWHRPSPDSPATDADGDPAGIVLRQEEHSLVAHSFRSLPDRWQSVLWLRLVDEVPAGQVATLLGIAPSGVSSLLDRAVEGLRKAYLQAHVRRREDSECVHYGGQLGETARRSSRPHGALRRHLAECAHCRSALAQLRGINSRLGAMLPIALTPPGASHLFTDTTQALLPAKALKATALTGKWAAATVGGVGVLTTAALLVAILPGHRGPAGDQQPQLGRPSAPSRDGTPAPTTSTATPAPTPPAPSPSPSTPKASRSSAAPPPSTEQLLVDPDFEAAGASPWRATAGASVVSAHPHAGQHAVRLTSQASRVEQTIVVVPQGTYQLSGHAAVSADGDDIALGAQSESGLDARVKLKSVDLYAWGAVSFTT
ncbi:sigma-70 family RNA polymerase sigma factor, partial [Kitasatospora sp. NPDC005748]|uniref:sigma-70 family RNA polymerase sigma factor n=1 Tax=Kitasatospora sp. NPDC005748 TaxID=3157063 RepID=UPI0033F188EE